MPLQIEPDARASGGIVGSLSVTVNTGFPPLPPIRLELGRPHAEPDTVMSRQSRMQFVASLLTGACRLGSVVQGEPGVRS